MASFLTYYENIQLAQQSLLLARLTAPLTKRRCDSPFTISLSIPQDLLKSQEGLDSGPDVLPRESLPKLGFKVSAQLGHPA